MWIVQRKIGGKWTAIVTNIPDEETADEWIHMLKRNHPDDEFKRKTSN